MIAAVDLAQPTHSVVAGRAVPRRGAGTRWDPAVGAALFHHLASGPSPVAVATAPRCADI